MNRSITAWLLLCIGLLPLARSSAQNTWQPLNEEKAPRELQLLFPTHFELFTLDENPLKLALWSLSSDPEEAINISLPMPDGSFRDFRVWQTPMMPDELATQFPEIKTFTAEVPGKPNITAKLDFTVYGFHAMIFDGENTSFIDPYDNFHDGIYMVHYKKDEICPAGDRMRCMTLASDESALNNLTHRAAQKTVNGAVHRTYRLALACSHQYAQAVTALANPTVAQTLSKMTTTMNRVNGVYERELSISMTFVANETSIIFTTAAGDPYGPDNLNASALLNDNQTTCDNIIGNANYDIGHVFTTGGGGLSDLACVCQTGIKAQSETGSPSPKGDGFDIDYVAHEMGHEFGSDHTFNNNVDGSCAGNAASSYAYEPGSGSTIMAYAGICPSDDLQPHSDPYFTASSLLQIQTYTTMGAGNSCPSKATTNNKLVGYAPFDATYSIPYQTPFELIAPVATDSVSDSVTLYCWEQWDLGDFGSEFINTHISGPIFRSFSPSLSTLRVFPKMSMVLAGTLSNAGIENAQGEKVPDVARTLTFRCTFRDILHNFGAFTFPDDKITLNAINTGSGFKVTSQSTAGIVYTGHTTQTITWNVAFSNVAPINATNVNIYMSADGGTTWPYFIGTYPNNGSVSITLPNPASSTTAARFKVKGAGNVFFNVNGSNFSVLNNPAFPSTPAGIAATSSAIDQVKVYPVPAHDVLMISVPSKLSMRIYNSIGQQIWKDTVPDHAEISVKDWPRGLYYLSVTDEHNAQTIKKLIVN